MAQFINLLLLISAALIAYFLSEIFYRYERFCFEEEIKKFFKSELNRYQAIKVMKEAERLMLEGGYHPKDARRKAIEFGKEITENGLLFDKYKLLKGA